MSDSFVYSSPASKLEKIEPSDTSMKMLSSILDLHKEMLKQHAEIVKGLARPVWIVDDKDAK